MKKCSECGVSGTDDARYCANCGSKMPNSPVEGGMKKKTNNIFLGVLFGVLAVWAVFLIIYQVFFNLSTVDGQMMRTASDMNASCPIMIDQDTRLDNMLAFPPRTFQYNYSLINYEKEFTDTLLLKGMIEQNLIKYLRTNPEAKFLRDNKVTLRYHYRDRNGLYLFQMLIKPEEYKAIE